jgi:hypothetical protein
VLNYLVEIVMSNPRKRPTDEQVAQFLSICGSNDAELAASYLAAARNSLEEALEMFFRGEVPKSGEGASSSEHKPEEYAYDYSGASYQVQG